MKKVFTTGDVAVICRVTINTVVKWFDSGKLKGYRIPSSRARRIPRNNLLSFMKEYDFPMDEVISDKTRILVVDSDRTTQSRFRRALAKNENFILESASSGFEAGLKAADFMPDIIFLNVDIGDVDRRRFCNVLHGNEETAGTVVVAMSEKLKKDDAGRLKRLGFAEAVRKPLRAGPIREIAARHTP